jgi:protein-tyrosine phosphatase
VAAFDIHEISVAGGTVALCQLPGSSGNYASDFNRIVEWKPDLVISLTEPHEMAEFEVSNLGSDLQAKGVAWTEWPVRDYAVPKPAQAVLSASIKNETKTILKGAGRILVHCKGGCGRTGMVVLSFMVDAGEDPDAGLIRLRAVRPCAVETDEQRAWASYQAD